MDLKETIVADLTAAMKARDADTLSTLRMVKANLMNRQIEKGGELTDAEVEKALQSLVKQRRDSIQQYQQAGRTELVEKETVELKVIQRYLPQEASASEIEAAIRAAIAETGANSIKDMGTVMKVVPTHLAGKFADGKVVSDAVRSYLQRIS